jgi:sodium/pantothenate symporter
MESYDWVKWVAFGLYIVVTFYLAWLGNKKTSSLDSYAVGNQDMKPWVVAFALAATMTSTATFVINPGFVYAYGISALCGFGIAAGGGLFLGIIILSKGFRKYGNQTKALTVPQWIGQRFDSTTLTIVYALMNMVMIAMVVLIAYGSAILIDTTLGLVQIFPTYHFEAALLFIILFVFSYTFFGGTYAHVYTNTVQGFLMIAVALLLVGSGWHLLSGELWTSLKAQDPNLLKAINPTSALFRNFFEVFVANFCVGFALTAQPHFLIKSLYVKTDAEVNKYLLYTVIIGLLYLLVMSVGLYSRVLFEGQYLGSIDQVTSLYIAKSFHPAITSLVSIALLAAGMSTLDGILVALTAIFSNDLYLNLRKSSLESLDRQARLKLALRVSQLTLVGLGILAYVLCLQQYYSKSLSIAIYAQTWIYAFCNVSVFPLICGMFDFQIRRSSVFLAAFISVATHLSLRFIPSLSLFTNDPSLRYPGDHINPGLTAGVGILAGLAVLLMDWLYSSRKESETQ